MADRIFASTPSGSGWSSCTNMDEHGTFCDAPTDPASGLSLCRRHLVAAFSYCQEVIDRLPDDRLNAMPLEQLALNYRTTLNQTRNRRLSVVYYAAMDGLVKIGTTIALDSRMKTLGANLMATEPGSYDLERQRHEQFAELLARGREYFRPGKALLAHVVELQR